MRSPLLVLAVVLVCGLLSRAGPVQPPEMPEPVRPPEARPQAWVDISDTEIAFARRPFGGVRGVRSRGGDERVLFPGLGMVAPLGWSTDGTCLAIRSDFPVEVRMPGGARGYRLEEQVWVVCLGEPKPALVADREIRPDPQAWAPSGHCFLYVSWDGEKGELRIFDASTSAQRTLASDVDYGNPASWSPDGRRIAYVRNEEAGGVLAVTAADTGASEALTEPGLTVSAPVWSPDGGTIAFLGDKYRPKDLFVVEPTGGQPRRITSGDLDYRPPAWSPDGRMIALLRYGEDGHVLACVALATGEVHTLATDVDWQYSERQPVRWSPDGGWLAFVRRLQDNEDIWIVRPDGTELTQLTSHAAVDHCPRWSPDESEIAFVSKRDGNPEIYKVSVGTGEVTRLTEHPDPDEHPVWRPAQEP